MLKYGDGSNGAGEQRPWGASPGNAGASACSAAMTNAELALGAGKW